MLVHVDGHRVSVWNCRLHVFAWMSMSTNLQMKHSILYAIGSVNLKMLVRQMVFLIMEGTLEEWKQRIQQDDDDWYAEMCPTTSNGSRFI